MIHRDLRSYLGFAFFLAIPACILGALIVFYPGLFFEDPSPPVLVRIAGALLLLVGFLIPIALKKHLRAQWVLRHVQPQGAKIRVLRKSDSDSTSYHVELYLQEVDRPPLTLAIYPPPKAILSELGELLEGRVYRDPRSGRPMVVRLDRGTLWAM